MALSFFGRLSDVVMRAHARRRARRLDRTDFAQVQQETCLRLVRTQAGTRFGREHGFAEIRTVGDYQRQVPLRTFEDFWRDYWAPAFPRLRGITWQDEVPYYALSSGTTSGTTKLIPVTAAMIRSNQRAALTVLAWFRAAHPQARLFTGKMLLLGGSTDLQPVVERLSEKQAQRALKGDLSGIAALTAPRLARPWMFPPLDLALLNNWDQKLDHLTTRSVREPITMLSGVPSWLLALGERLRAATGKGTLAEIWPSLQVVVHGGTCFDPYRRLFRELVGDDRVRFLETYPASEGFVAAEDPRCGGLRLIPDHDVFFEFVPPSELRSPRPTRLTAWEVECGIPYAVVLTTCAGLWSYVLGDLVTFERLDPPVVRFSGRTSQYLSAFGEHLIGEEVERAVTVASHATQAAISDFHVGPQFPETLNGPGRHRWLIEFARPPRSLEQFARKLDAELASANDDYLAHRVGDVTLGPPLVESVAPGGFQDWLRFRGQLGGQHKVPRLDNSGTTTEQMSEFFVTRGWITQASDTVCSVPSLSESAP